MEVGGDSGVAEAGMGAVGNWGGGRGAAGGEGVGREVDSVAAVVAVAAKVREEGKLVVVEAPTVWEEGRAGVGGRAHGSPNSRSPTTTRQCGERPLRRYFSRPVRNRGCRCRSLHTPCRSKRS